MGFDCVSNRERNPSVEAMVDEAAAVLEAVAEDSWVVWGMQVLPNVVAQVRAEGGEGSEFTSKALELLFTVEAEKDADEDIAHWEACHQEKLEAFLDKRIMQEEFKRDSEGDTAMVERSEAKGDKEIMEVETQVSGEMDVDSGEDEVVSITTQKQVPSSPPKTIQKRARATAGSQETVVAVVVSQDGSAVACEWCLWQGVACICTGDGTRCVNCCDKHTRCSFIPVKDGEGKGTSSGMQCVTSSARPQTKGPSTGAPATKGVDHLGRVKSGTLLVSISFPSPDSC